MPIPKKTQVIFLFPFGKSIDNKSNQLLLDIARKASANLGRILILCPNNFLKTENIIFVGEDSSIMANASKMIKEAQKRRLRKILIISPPQYTWRCMRDCQQLSLDIYGTQIFEFESYEFPPEYKSNYFYCKKNYQLSFIGIFINKIRESALRYLVPWILYKNF